MSAENNLSKSDVKKSKFQKTQESLRSFEGFEVRKFPNYCKIKSDLVFQNKVFEVFNDFHKTS